MEIIPAESSRLSEWLDLRVKLWPECARLESEREIRSLLLSPREDAFLAVDSDGRVIGFAEVSTRDYVDGCHTRPVGYLEGIYVRPDHRHHGVARKLVLAAEAWATRKGCSEMGSDARLDDTGSIAFHQALGFQETERQVVFLKSIG
jgi:aminoglycoside 6'-N-acetyltransferase I